MNSAMTRSGSTPYSMNLWLYSGIQRQLNMVNLVTFTYNFISQQFTDCLLDVGPLATSSKYSYTLTYIIHVIITYYLQVVAGA